MEGDRELKARLTVFFQAAILVVYVPKVLAEKEERQG